MPRRFAVPAVALAGSLGAVLLLAHPSLSRSETAPAEPAKSAQQTGDAKPAPDAKPQPPSEAKGAPPQKTRFKIVEAGPFTQSTSLEGKVGVNLQGVWLLVSNVEVAKGIYRNFPQLIKVTQGKDGPKFELLDVTLPDSVQQSVKAAKTAKWEPSPEVRKTLAKDWAQLPLQKEKKITDVIYDKIYFALASPDHYTGFAKKSALTDKALDGSKFAIRVVEDYRPRELPPHSRVALLIQRASLYGVKSAEPNVLQGEQVAGFIAAGVGTPITYELPGAFTMYRLASAS